jgi:hypothetical protein
MRVASDKYYHNPSVFQAIWCVTVMWPEHLCCHCQLRVPVSQMKPYSILYLLMQQRSTVYLIVRRQTRQQPMYYRCVDYRPTSWMTCHQARWRGSKEAVGEKEDLKKSEDPSASITDEAVLVDAKKVPNCQEADHTTACVCPGVQTTSWDLPPG